MPSMSRCSVAAAAAFMVSAACTHQVRPSPRPVEVSGDKLPLRAKYYLDPVDQKRVHSSSYWALGKAHTWNIEIGEALAASFPQMLQTVFSSVAVASGPQDLEEADVLIVPSINHFALSGGDYISTIEIRVRGVDKAGGVAIDEVILGQPVEGRAGTAWAAGVFGGEAALRGSAEYAFEDVLSRIRARLREVFIKGYPAS